jgi:hypothetical protein
MERFNEAMIVARAWSWGLKMERSIRSHPSVAKKLAHMLS